MRILCSLILALSLLSCGGPSAQSDKKPKPTTIRKAPQTGSLAWSLVLTIYQFFAELFGTKRQAITKHLQNIYECDELKKEATSSILELVRKEGKSTRI